MSEGERKQQPYTKVDKTSYGTRVYGVSSTGPFERFVPTKDKAKPQTEPKGTGSAENTKK